MQSAAPDATDIFVSYATEDRETAERLVWFLEDQSWKVFWDQNLRGGEQWPISLEQQLEKAKCVLVLWSNTSVQSDWVREEAGRGRDRQVLVPARIDDCKLPFGYRRIQTEDLRGWHDDQPPSGIAPLMSAVRELVEDVEKHTDRAEQDLKIRKGEKSTRSEHISVSDHTIDRDAILRALIDQPDDIRELVTNGYTTLESAQEAAKQITNDNDSRRHYGSAAVYFKRALDAIGDRRRKIARASRSVEYFLSMERANSLAFSEFERGAAHDEALAIYERLANDRRYKNDPPVFFRLGCALARSARDQSTILKAIGHLQKARELAYRADEAAGITDTLLSEGAWLYFEISKQLGYCNYRQSELPNVTSKKRIKFLDEAIQNTQDAVERPAPKLDPHELIKVTQLKSQGNLIYFLGQKIREGRGIQADRDKIASLIAMIKQPQFWEIAECQVPVIDSVAYGAAAIGDWKTASEDAALNVENFASLATQQSLSPDEMAMQARAKEIQFFAERFIACEKLASSKHT
ncbi:MAG: toll/interleukin-1 receptor domain-containing protein [Hyphomicrobium sp.]